MIYKAWSLKDQRKEWIEDYPTVDDAVGDVLGMWPEDDNDVEIVDQYGVTVAVMARGNDPAVCHVFERGKPTGIFRCEYRRGVNGKVITDVKPMWGRVS